MERDVWRVLVIEDDPDGQELVASILAHLSIACDVAGDAATAERFLFASDARYTGIVIDLALPDKDGWEVLDTILNQPATQSIPCVAVTAYHTSRLREQALQAGFTAYFPKPIDTTAFARRLESLM